MCRIREAQELLRRPNAMNHRPIFVCLLISTVVYFSGCSRKELPVEFEPNFVHAMKYEVGQGVPTQQALEDTTWVVSKFFGTPDEPKLPAAITEDGELSKLLSMARLEKASGPDSGGRGLYRKHCANCHGVTGNGRGPQGAILPVYPRDYRHGTFKFKSTERGYKPTRDDLAGLIRNGIAGTAMVKIPTLKEEDIQALVDYVIYLSIRGQFERLVISGAVNDLDLEAGDRVLDTAFAGIAESDTELIDKLAAINEETDSDELLDYEAALDFQKTLQSDGKLKEIFANENSDQVDTDLKALMLERFTTKSELSKQIVKLDEYGQETVDDLVNDTPEEQLLEAMGETLADLVVEQHDDYLSMMQDLADDAEMKKRLESVAGQTSGKQLQRYEDYVEGWDYILSTVTDLAGDWLDAENHLVDVPEPPSDIPVADSQKEFVTLMNSDQASALKESIAKGQALFRGAGACNKCHGDKGLGDGQNKDYDDWTKDWTLKVGIKPEEQEKLVPLFARGALPPRNAMPRNFQEGIFRGGSTAKDLYLRIIGGIEGTPMPGVTITPGKFEQSDIWHLINFIRSLQKQAEPDAAGMAVAEPR